MFQIKKLKESSKSQQCHKNLKGCHLHSACSSRTEYPNIYLKLSPHITTVTQKQIHVYGNVNVGTC